VFSVSGTPDEGGTGVLLRVLGQGPGKETLTGTPVDGKFGGEGPWEGRRSGQRERLICLQILS
jgi:hypothetical protein